MIENLDNLTIENLGLSSIENLEKIRFSSIIRHLGEFQKKHYLIRTHKKWHFLCRCNQDKNCENGEDESLCTQIVLPKGYNRDQVTVVVW